VNRSVWDIVEPYEVGHPDPQREDLLLTEQPAHVPKIGKDESIAVHPKAGKVGHRFAGHEKETRELRGILQPPR
jgi:hypothetical protein